MPYAAVQCHNLGQFLSNMDVKADLRRCSMNLTKRIFGAKEVDFFTFVKHSVNKVDEHLVESAAWAWYNFEHHGAWGGMPCARFRSGERCWTY